MDIKYIGSGEVTKALVFYIMDYATKSTLATHIGLGALTYSIKQNDRKFKFKPLATTDTKQKSLFTKLVNSIMARQENSHQQVSSYMCGGGDHYKSHQFQLLRWCDFNRFVRKELREAVWMQ